MTPTSQQSGPDGNSWREVPTLGPRVAEFIATEILKGRWADGQRLPETEIAEELGISRGPVREALRTLADQGFITLRPRIGAIVHLVSQTMIAEIYELRAILESWLCRQVVSELTPEDIRRAEERIDEMELRLAESDYAGFYEAGWELRRAIYAKCHNTLVPREVETLRTRLYGLHSLWRQEENAKQYLDTYREFLPFIAANDAEGAARCIDRMMRETGLSVASHYRSMQEDASSLATQAEEARR